VGLPLGVSANILRSNNVNFSDFVKPICLPTLNELKQQTLEGNEMEVAGWGKTETSKST
jgi:hypothetical protein